MARAVSWNWHIELEDTSEIHAKTIAGFGSGEEGRIEVSDGSRKYRIRDNIFDVGEIPVTIYLRDNYADPNSEYSKMENWTNNNIVQDIFIVATDITGSGAKMKWQATECELAKGKKNDFDRNAKEADTMSYVILPREVEPIDLPGTDPSNVAPDANA